jgi:hypothetical protein
VHFHSWFAKKARDSFTRAPLTWQTLQHFAQEREIRNFEESHSKIVVTEVERNTDVLGLFLLFITSVRFFTSFSDNEHFKWQRKSLSSVIYFKELTEIICIFRKRKELEIFFKEAKPYKILNWFFEPFIFCVFSVIQNELLNVSNFLLIFKTKVDWQHFELKVNMMNK